ncbi:hypothetical protein HDV04_005027 [Boothiomyces sp. JEL0838]|nr:hypothetical protein HDV04_005027 [Boothiomyces sp. JEL0838]
MRKIIDSSDEEVEKETVQDQQQKEAQVQDEAAPATEEPYLSDESDESNYDYINVPKRPTKKDRIEAQITSQKAIRELHVELPVAKSKLSINKFLQKYQKKVEPDFIPEAAEEPVNTKPKTDHLIQVDPQPDESDIEIEIIKKPSLKQISNNAEKKKVGLNQEMLKLAKRQLEQRRLEMQEEMKREEERRIEERRARKEERRKREEEKLKQELAEEMGINPDTLVNDQEMNVENEAIVDDLPHDTIEVEKSKVVQDEKEVVNDFEPIALDYCTDEDEFFDEHKESQPSAELTYKTSLPAIESPDTVQVSDTQVEISQNIFSLLSGKFTDTTESQSIQQKQETIEDSLSQDTPVENVSLEQDSQLLNLLSGKFNSDSALLGKNIEDLISESEEEDEESSAEEESETEEVVNVQTNAEQKPIEWIIPEKIPVVGTEKNGFVEIEADVEDDEFLNHGGIDGEDAGVNEYEADMIAEVDSKAVDGEDLLDIHHQQLAEMDAEQVKQVLEDITGGFKKKRARGIQFYDSDEEGEEILKKIRAQMGFNAKKKKEDQNKDKLSQLLDNEKTKEFANCFMTKEAALLSSDEENDVLESANLAKLVRLKEKPSKINKYADRIKKVSVDDLESVSSSQHSLPENIGGQIIQSIFKSKSETNVKVQKSVLSRFSSTRLLSKKSIQIMDTSVYTGDNQGHVKMINKSASAFKIKKTGDVEKKENIINFNTTKKVKVVKTVSKGPKLKDLIKK